MRSLNSRDQTPLVEKPTCPDQGECSGRGEGRVHLPLLARRGPPEAEATYRYHAVRVEEVERPRAPHLVERTAQLAPDDTKGRLARIYLMVVMRVRRALGGRHFL